MNRPTIAKPLLDVRDLTVSYSRGGRPFTALREVDISIGVGETLGIVGESGSGKSTLGRAILGLAPVEAGTIVFDGEDITHAPGRRRRDLSRDLQVVFQDPYSSLNPARTIGQTMAETVRVHGQWSATSTRERITHLLERVGLSADAAGKYPGRFSGGQRQRIAIARALMAQPRLVICDEPVSALDLSVQAQVVNLLRDLQSELGLSYLFIAHDLDIVRHLSDRIAVIYRGRVMEQGPSNAVYTEPTTDYTRKLLDAAPVPDPERQRARRLARQASPNSNRINQG